MFECLVPSTQSYEEMLDFHVQIPFAMNGKQKDSCIEVGNSYDNVF